MTLAELLDKYSGPDSGASDKNSIHSYGPVYEALFAPIRDTAQNILEVGVRSGGSLKTWAGYFPNAHIVGIDNGSEIGMWQPDSPRITVHEADSTKPETLHWLGQGWPPFDVIIDDGLHHPYVQVATFAALWPLVRVGGLYITEDVEDIEYARTMARLFGGSVVDLREVKQRHDDILVVWRKGSA